MTEQMNQASNNSKTFSNFAFCWKLTKYPPEQHSFLKTKLNKKNLSNFFGLFMTLAEGNSKNYHGLQVLP